MTAANPPSPEQDFPEPFSAASLSDSVPPPRIWHVPGLIPARAVTLLGGDGGTGKSTLGLQLCFASCSDAQWLSLEPRRGPCLYLSAEDDKDELHRRLDALSTFYGTTLDKLEGLMLWDLAEHESALSIASGFADRIESTDLFARLAAKAEIIRPRLIVLDALADVFAGNEISRTQVRQFVSALRGLAIRSDAAVLALGHPSLRGIDSGSGLSGSTAWNNSVRSRLVLSCPDPQDPDARLLCLKKANYAPAGVDLRLRRQGGGYSREGRDVGASLDLASQRAKIDEDFLRLLNRYQAQERNVSDKPGANFAPALFAREPEASGATKGALATAMNRLFVARRVEVRTTGPPSRPTRQLVCADPPERSDAD